MELGLPLSAAGYNDLFLIVALSGNP